MEMSSNTIHCKKDRYFDVSVSVLVAALTTQDPYGPTAVCGGDLSLFPLLVTSLLVSCIKAGTVWIIACDEKIVGVIGLIGPGQALR